MPSAIPLIGLDEIADGAARGLEVERHGETLRVLLVRRGERLFAYENRCPHRGTPLDWVPDHFLDREGHFIVCATHGARFEIEDGRCVAGPCAGDRLRQLTIELSGDTWVLPPDRNPTEAQRSSPGR